MSILKGLEAGHLNAANPLGEGLEETLPLHRKKTLVCIHITSGGGSIYIINHIDRLLRN